MHFRDIDQRSYNACGIFFKFALLRADSFFSLSLGVIYLKNMITQHWSDGDGSGTETPVNNIPDEDRLFIRDSIVEAILQSPERIR